MGGFQEPNALNSFGIRLQSVIERYILFHNLRHPKDMGMPEINQVLTHLAVEKMEPILFHQTPIHKTGLIPHFAPYEPNR